MTNNIPLNRKCPDGTEIVKAVGIDDITPALREHIANCATCKEISSVAQHFKMLVSVRETRLHSAEFIYWRAMVKKTLETQRQRHRHTLRPIRLLHLTTAWSMTTAAAFLFLWPLVAEAQLVPTVLNTPLVFALITAGVYYYLQANLIPASPRHVTR